MFKVRRLILCGPHLQEWTSGWREHLNYSLFAQHTSPDPPCRPCRVQNRTQWPGERDANDCSHIRGCGKLLKLALENESVSLKFALWSKVSAACVRTGNKQLLLR